MIDVKTHKDRERDQTLVTAKFDNIELSGDIYAQVSRIIAEEYVREHYQEIIKHIDQKAIATLSVAEAAAAIRVTLEKKMPDKILEVVKTKSIIIQKSIFGTKIIG